MDTVSLKNLLKFVVGTLLGLFLVVIPLNFGKNVDTFTFYYLKKFVSWMGHPLEILMTTIIVLSAFIAWIDVLAKPKWIEDHPMCRSLFSCTKFEAFVRLLGAVFAVCSCFTLGPEFMTSIDTGGTMLPLATQLSILIPPMILFQTFILEFGLMEFLGTIIGFIMKPLFKVTEMASVSIISAWLGPVSAGAMAAKQFFDEGYFTVKEAATVAACFAVSSIGWCSLVANVLGVMDYFSYFYLTIVVVGIILAIATVRIPPLFTDKISSMVSYVVSLQPIVMCYGMVALILCTYTPILTYLSYPIGWFMDLTGVPEAYTAAPAIISGFADNYLPIILGKAVASPQTKFIVGTMSILELIYMSEIGALLISTKLVKNMGHVALIFIERTVIALPFVVLISTIIF